MKHEAQLATTLAVNAMHTLDFSQLEERLTLTCFYGSRTGRSSAGPTDGYQVTRNTLEDHFETRRAQSNALMNSLRAALKAGDMANAWCVYLDLKDAEKRLQAAAQVFMTAGRRRYTDKGDFTNCYRGGF